MESFARGTGYALPPSHRRLVSSRDRSIGLDRLTCCAGRPRAASLPAPSSARCAGSRTSLSGRMRRVSRRGLVRRISRRACCRSSLSRRHVTFVAALAPVPGSASASAPLEVATHAHRSPRTAPLAAPICPSSSTGARSCGLRLLRPSGRADRRARSPPCSTLLSGSAAPVALPWHRCVLAFAHHGTESKPACLCDNEFEYDLNVYAISRSRARGHARVRLLQSHRSARMYV